MEKIEYEYRKKECIIHSISCDICGKHIYDSEEYDDGYYHNPGSFELGVCNRKTWYYLRKCLCEECKEKVNNNFVSMLVDFGFEKKIY